MTRRFKDGGVSQCFHCGRQLYRIKGGFIFEHIKDPDGHLIRVHKDCLTNAVGHGYTKVKESQHEAEEQAGRPRQVG